MKSLEFAMAKRTGKFRNLSPKHNPLEIWQCTNLITTELNDSTLLDGGGGSYGSAHEMH